MLIRSRFGFANSPTRFETLHRLARIFAQAAERFPRQRSSRRSRRCSKARRKRHNACTLDWMQPTRETSKSTKSTTCSVNLTQTVIYTIILLMDSVPHLCLWRLFLVFTVPSSAPIALRNVSKCSTSHTFFTIRFWHFSSAAFIEKNASAYNNHCDGCVKNTSRTIM